VQFLVLAFDGTDPEAPLRRLTARPAHLALAAIMKKEGCFLDGGAILNDHGEMIGSMLLMEFESRQALQTWLDEDPYVTGNVWQNIEVRQFRRATLPS